ncbi:hypothetical protein CKO15_09270 [Halorhodospira abdelmalekii]|uniref:prepilin-type N-terminal cleavage/methylation domain-containing protein n=1 Tax=Halorhodospira abdelmalekii TaxID=421629 RepID=UPI001908DD3C|nr:prepilin-type N-terminal cleavage/methylation domain-containing protein [Halorhodospira abdelmalekii]MBK1735468.1 hypothetical protein [Halorhodospira abdelmalekii]
MSGGFARLCQQPWLERPQQLQQPKHSRPKQHGLSLAELLAALAISSVAILAALELHSSALQTSVTVDRLEQLADKTRLLQRILHAEIALAGAAPCGGRTPVSDWSGGTMQRVDATLPAGGGLRMEGETLQIARFSPDPLDADGHYVAWTHDEHGLFLHLDVLPGSAVAPVLGERLLIGDCQRLHRVRVSVGGGGRIAVDAGGESQLTALAAQLPATGSIWREAVLRGDAVSDDPRRRQTRLRHAAMIGVDGVPTLRIDNDPTLRGVTELEWWFAACSAPLHFRPASVVEQWDEVCAVQARARLEVGEVGVGGGALSESLVVTVPLLGRLL